MRLSGSVNNSFHEHTSHVRSHIIIKVMRFSSVGTRRGYGVDVVQQASQCCVDIDSMDKQYRTSQAAGVHATALWAGDLSIKASLQGTGKTRIRSQRVTLFSFPVLTVSPS